VNEGGDALLAVRRELLKRVTEFEEFSRCYESDVMKAKGLVAEIRRVIDVKDSFTRMNQEREREAEARRAEHQRKTITARERREKIVAAKAGLFALFGETNPHRRGKALEPVLNDLFRAHGALVAEDFRRKGPDGGIEEQIDGVVEFDTQMYLVELKWREVLVAPSRTGVRGRVATVALRAGPVVICRPRHGHDPSAPPQLKLTMVEAREVDGTGDSQPLLWRLLTTLDVADAAGAADIVRLYRLRWRIEEIFRSLKADGMRLEDTQVQDAGRLFKLALVGLAAATRTMQLVDARDGSPRPATDVIDASVLPAAEAIAPTLEGKTARQRNPHPRQSLAWLSWIIARLGGWNCYYKPPGPKTMRAGWAQFAAMAAGFALAAQSNV